MCQLHRNSTYYYVKQLKRNEIKGKKISGRSTNSSPKFDGIDIRYFGARGQLWSGTSIYYGIFTKYLTIFILINHPFSHTRITNIQLLLRSNVSENKIAEIK